MSDTKFGLKVVAVCLFVLVLMLGGYVLLKRSEPKPKRHKCPPCKCECKEKKKVVKAPEVRIPVPRPRSTPRAEPANMRPRKITIESEANSYFLSWLEECKKKSKHAYVNLLACIRWFELRKFMNVDFVDEVMIRRRKIVHLVLDRLGSDLCSRKTGDRKHDYYITKELAAIYSNARENIRRLKLLKKDNPSLEIPQMRMCQLKSGRLVWDLP